MFGKKKRLDGLEVYEHEQHEAIEHMTKKKEKFDKQKAWNVTKEVGKGTFHVGKEVGKGIGSVLGNMYSNMESNKRKRK